MCLGLSFNEHFQELNILRVTSSLVFLTLSVAWTECTSIGCFKKGDGIVFVHICKSKTLNQFGVVAFSSVSSKLRLSNCEMANLTEDAAVTLRSLQIWRTETEFVPGALKHVFLYLGQMVFEWQKPVLLCID